jgi:FMN reductase (NADPH)
MATEVNTPENAFLCLMHDHRSVRSFVPDAEIPAAHERAFITAAQRAPTSCNLQTYAFLSIKNRALRTSLSDLAGGNSSVVEAGLFLIVCVDLHKMEIVAKKTGYRYHQAQFLESFLMAAIDASLAAENAALAAESLGYGVCMIGSLRSRAEEVWKILDLPEKVFPLFGMTVGVPSKRNPVKPRLPLSAVLFQDRYDTEAVQRAIAEYDQTMKRSGIYNGREIDTSCCSISDAKYDGKAGDRSSADYGWIEHSGRRISSTNPLDARPLLRAVLERAGFGFE